MAENMASNIGSNIGEKAVTNPVTKRVPAIFRRPNIMNKPAKARSGNRKVCGMNSDACPSVFMIPQ